MIFSASKFFSVIAKWLFPFLSWTMHYFMTCNFIFSRPIASAIFSASMPLPFFIFMSISLFSLLSAYSANAANADTCRMLSPKSVLSINSRIMNLYPESFVRQKSPPILFIQFFLFIDAICLPDDFFYLSKIYSIAGS